MAKMPRKRANSGAHGPQKRKKGKKEAEAEPEEVPLTRYEQDTSSDSDSSSDGEENKAQKREAVAGSKWTNRERVLVFGSRGISHRDRHLMDDLRGLMPHARADSKMQRKETLFVINEIAEMKNCNKCLFFEARKNRKDLYLWAANVARGPSAKFQVENVHTMGELKMTGNCLKSSRPLLSFDKTFEALPHFKVMKELFTQIFGVPNHHPKSQPFFDHVYTFAVVDDKIWFRNFQIVEEDGSLAEIGPRFVLNPIKVFEASFSGQTLWENPDYKTPTAHRILLKRLKAGKYQQSVQAKAAYEASRPTESTYDLDKNDEVFSTIVDEDAEARKKERMEKRQPLKKAKNKKRAAKAVSAGGDGE